MVSITSSTVNDSSFTMLSSFCSLTFSVILSKLLLYAYLIARWLTISIVAFWYNFSWLIVHLNFSLFSLFSWYNGLVFCKPFYRFPYFFRTLLMLFTSLFPPILWFLYFMWFSIFLSFFYLFFLFHFSRFTFSFTSSLYHYLYFNIFFYHLLSHRLLKLYSITLF